jgi:hypothetical protein
VQGQSSPDVAMRVSTMQVVSKLGTLLLRECCEDMFAVSNKVTSRCTCYEDVRGGEHEQKCRCQSSL